ncbi:MAG: tRNA uridine-5-carboxymethylaminomethyl(34) synthesis GTPase MnmE [Bacilli bacterium]|jgi:tRNA modification GTPase|nr:tRNA uridine-5-carboxymethylaminomethyl(34) synthesis GTPase MnmE [Bacilli bacterium]MEE0634315.1 tRNA uridine-5-carboxymethylaminomethyl(34) synthesis GTPase MnmE [Bacilli bacterium]HJJ19981.1 tRNA uridine-5-carboxymethylaminomethyl(34) synthesis GTPase MnmE [Bacilli bacterium]
MEDTIVAISTSVGEGAISIIRLSGHDALNIASKVFTKDLTKVDSHTIHYGFITSNNEKIDEVLVSVMKAPKTFTREDIVEINCHGGIATTNKVLEVLLENGARLAEPGEFTKRAFLNGRIDLLEAEATMDLISSKAESARKISINTLTGETSNLIKNLRSELVKIISNIEVNIDYPEYEDIEVLTNESILPDIKKFKEKLEEIIKKSEDSKVIKEGIRVGIIGRPNVGKSSLLNSLLEEEKAIVTDVPGTTRDIVEGSLIVSGIPLNIIDTAGIRKTEDTVEKIGVEKSLKIIDTSDLLIYILNNNEEITEEEKEILEKTKNKKRIIVVNKIDLKTKLNKKLLDSYIEISVKENIGIDKIKDEIKRLFNIGEISTNDMTYLSNARSIALLKKSLNNINDAINEINNNNPIDIVELSLKESWNNLGEVIGETYTDELLDELFSRFCLGK